MGANQDDDRPLETVVLDAADQPLLIVVTATAEPAAHRVLNGRRATTGPCPGLVVTAQSLCFYDDDDEPLASLDVQLLSDYHPQLSAWRPGPRLLMTLVSAWLGDIAHGWRSTPPPGLETLQRCGLAERLRTGVHQVTPDDQGGLRP